MPEVNGEFINLEVFLDECDPSEKDELLNLMIANLSKNDRGTAAGVYQKSLIRLMGNRHRLSLEDEERINKIANKI